MTNPGFIPPVDWDLKSDGEQNSQDLQTYSLQIEAEILRLEEWEMTAVQQYFFGTDETVTWDSHLCQSQIDLMFDIWTEEYCEPRPFVRDDFPKIIRRTTLPDDLIVLHQSVLRICAENRPSNWRLGLTAMDEELQEDAATYCASRWDQPGYRSVLRCLLEPDGCVNIVREGALARTRFWIKRILQGRFAARSREDLAGLIRISRALLSRIRASYTWEAPSSFLGADDSEIVRWTYPLVCGIPAECSVPKKQLRKEWKADKCEFGEIGFEWCDFEDYSDARRFLDYSKWYRAEYQSRAKPTAYDVESECITAGMRMVAIAIREAERYGLPLMNLPTMQNENDCDYFVGQILRSVIAELPLNLTLPTNESCAETETTSEKTERKLDNSDALDSPELDTDKKTSKNKHSFCSLAAKAANTYKRDCDKAKKILPLSTWMAAFIAKNAGVALWKTANASTLTKKLQSHRDTWDPDKNYRR